VVGATTRAPSASASASDVSSVMGNVAAEARLPDEEGEEGIEAACTPLRLSLMGFTDALTLLFAPLLVFFAPGEPGEVVEGVETPAAVGLVGLTPFGDPAGRRARAVLFPWPFALRFALCDPIGRSAFL